MAAQSTESKISTDMLGERNAIEEGDTRVMGVPPAPAITLPPHNSVWASRGHGIVRITWLVTRRWQGFYNLEINKPPVLVCVLAAKQSTSWGGGEE